MAAVICIFSPVTAFCTKMVNIHYCFLGCQCELDIMFHLEKAHFMLEEMVMNGCVVETNKQNILHPIQLMDKTT